MTVQSKKNVRNYLRINILAIALVFSSITGLASHHEEHGHGGGADPSEEPIDPVGHVVDAPDWHLVTNSGGHVSIPLPVIIWSSDKGFEFFSSGDFHHEGTHVAGAEGEEYDWYVWEEAGYKMATKSMKVVPLDESRFVLDLSISKNVVALFIVSALLLIVFFAVKRGYTKNEGKAPKGIQSFFEPIIIFIRDEIAKENIGKNYERFLPFLLTIFFFIWFGNLFGLIPGSANLTGNIAVTMVLAILVFIRTVVNGGKTYWAHIFDPLGNALPWAGKFPLYLILWPIEIIGIVTKPFSLMIRLFANITAGHIIIISVIGLSFAANAHEVRWGVAPLAAAFATVMNMLELFVAILQAYVFTLLTSMYLGSAVEEAHH